MVLEEQMIKEKMKHILKEKMIMYRANGKKTYCNRENSKRETC